ncbi:hypothetical protein C1N80_05430 [Brachybacterium sp. SGAir0954]|uniref:uroporphyrinogen-III synthase n=1 Tax=Brachybacterium sp. SGAir0954 TaxID=2571029 RepID=UPI0010CD0450|nr:uroporphyrinogen-III synthase [Brachybacterium sp. SGAir0954]QCR53076.1 hypothetical protein C1N80_05430 [Brachybacterium sp. SGAir0954]
MTAASALPVLVPSAAGHGVPLIEALQSRGYTIDHCPFLELRPQRDADTRLAIEDLLEGRYAQVVVEGPLSAQLLVEDVLGTGSALPPGLRVVSAGFETTEALRAGGITPTATASDAEASIAQAVGPAGGGAAGDRAAAGPSELLLLGSALLPPTLRTSLERAGHRVTTVVGYRPRTTSLDPQVVRDLRLAGYSAVVLPTTLLASLAGHLGIHRDIRVITVHHEATGAAQAKGLTVHGEAAEPSPWALAAAVDASVRAAVPVTGRP